MREKAKKLNRQGLERMQKWLWHYAAHLGFPDPTGTALKRERDLDSLEAKWNGLHRSSPRDAQVLSARFGLQGETCRTTAEIAKELGCPVGSIGGFVHRALAKLKEARSLRPVEAVLESLPEPYQPLPYPVQYDKIEDLRVPDAAREVLDAQDKDDFALYGDHRDEPTEHDNGFAFYSGGLFGRAVAESIRMASKRREGVCATVAEAIEALEFTRDDMGEEPAACIPAPQPVVTATTTYPLWVGNREGKVSIQSGRLPALSMSPADARTLAAMLLAAASKEEP